MVLIYRAKFQKILTWADSSIGCGPNSRFSNHWGPWGPQRPILCRPSYCETKWGRATSSGMSELKVSNELFDYEPNWELVNAPVSWTRYRRLWKVCCETNLGLLVTSYPQKHPWPQCWKKEKEIDVNWLTARTFFFFCNKIPISG